jgi:hypothetical protein
MCVVGVTWWVGAAVLLGLAFIGRSPPPMTVRAPARIRMRVSLPVRFRGPSRC